MHRRSIVARLIEASELDAASDELLCEERSTESVGQLAIVCGSRPCEPGGFTGECIQLPV